ncbi:MAG: DUF58 domain-containing protein [Thermoleophilia bacterium]|nr:DUF58 domain-containing protein [Thermoleophilia bacterium]
MTQRGRLTLVLGVVLYAVAWLLGSRALYPVAVGLVAAPLAAALWVRLAARPERVERRTAREEHLEGDDVRVQLSADLRRGLRPAGLVLSERVGRLGEQRAPLDVHGRRAWGRYSLLRVPRGRYRFERASLVLEDPFALARAEIDVPTVGALLVYPRLVELDTLFSESGRDGHVGRRLLLRRPAGFELHGVRDYQDGESLRRVHWPSTAKRGRLMVKDLEDSPRDELAVVLDARAAAVAGESFDVQVRAAGSILLAYARRGRRSLLVVNGATVETHRVTSLEGDWHAAYGALAAVEATAAAPLSALLTGESGPVARAVELVVVTSALPRSVVDALARRSSGGRRTTLVHVDAATFAAGREGAASADLLRLGASGVAVTRVRAGDDLARALTGAEEAAMSRA